MLVRENLPRYCETLGSMKVGLLVKRPWVAGAPQAGGARDGARAGAADSPLAGGVVVALRPMPRHCSWCPCHTWQPLSLALTP